MMAAAGGSLTNPEESMTRLFTTGALAFALMSAALPAFAHPHLTWASPAVDAIIAVLPAQLELHFTETVEPQFTKAVLKTDSGIVVETGAAAIDAKDPAVLIVPLKGATPSGKFIVEWQAVAGDGHKSSGSYGFTVAP
jgi:copper resistance protein C